MTTTSHRIRTISRAACLTAAALAAGLAPAADAKEGKDHVYLISSFQQSEQGVTLAGSSDQGGYVEGDVVPSTTFKPAKLSRFAPGACRTAAAHFNAAQSFEAHTSALFEMAAFGCRVKLKLDEDTGTFKTIKPVP
ncbi:MAG TPA: hypothetical protein VD931_18080 [Baekduia sp.]|nr:hypothetical protein [Baekduia sp.]